jgi:hypothetical protein
MSPPVPKPLNNLDSREMFSAADEFANDSASVPTAMQAAPGKAHFAICSSTLKPALPTPKIFKDGCFPAIPAGTSVFESVFMGITSVLFPEQLRA